MNRKWPYITAILVLAVMLLMVATRPDAKEHHEAVAEAICNNLENTFGIDLNSKGTKKIMTSLMDTDNTLGFFANDVFGLGTDIKVTNYGLVSVGRLHGRKVISLGAFGHVFTFSDDVLNDYIESKVDDLPGPIRKMVKKAMKDDDDD